MAADTFSRENEQSAVYQQPETDEQKLKAMQALIACPTASIGCTDKSIDIRAAQDSMPILIEDNVYHCGYHSEKSYGAASYFIQRERGNILIDSPRFAMPLVRRLEEMGGIDHMFLTHRDDVADHKKFYEHFKCKRIIHKEELCSSIPDAEEIIDVNYPVALDDDYDERLLMIPVPGHTEGHMALLYKRKFLFTGDHMWYSARRNALHASKAYNWFSWEKQIESIEKLIDFDYEWLLPGHGRRIKSNPFAFKNHVDSLVEWMKGQ